ncbi:MAG: addiction module protein [Candidatus Methylumidiphilus sp.]
MNPSVTHLFEEASRLDEGDRAALAGLLLESSDQPPIAGVEATWADEIERRVRQMDLGEVETVPWEKVKNRLLAQQCAGHEG